MIVNLTLHPPSRQKTLDLSGATLGRACVGTQAPLLDKDPLRQANPAAVVGGLPDKILEEEDNG